MPARTAEVAITVRGTQNAAAYFIGNMANDK